MGLWRSGLDWRPLSRCLNKYWGEPEGNTNKSLPHPAVYQTRNEVYFCWEDRRSEHALVNFHSLHVCDIFPLHHPALPTTCCLYFRLLNLQHDQPGGRSEEVFLSQPWLGVRSMRGLVLLLSCLFSGQIITGPPPPPPGSAGLIETKATCQVNPPLKIVLRLWTLTGRDPRNLSF